MRMLTWVMGIKRIEKIRNEEITARAGVANTREKIKRSDTEMVRPCGEKHRRSSSNENMGDGSGWTPAKVFSHVMPSQSKFANILVFSNAYNLPGVMCIFFLFYFDE